MANIMVSTIIQLDKSIVNSLKEIREYQRQRYNELIKNMINLFKIINMMSFFIRSGRQR